jgi:hypothetical protein
MKRLFLGLCATAALWTAACSNGGSNVQPPPPAGKYSPANLKGQYSFVTTGEVFAGAVIAPLTRTGVFIADGLGGITGGIEDVNSSGLVSAAVQITGGSYTVNADGRGTVTLNIAGVSSINFGIVLTSTSNGGLLIDETSNSNQLSTGSGNFILQQSNPFALAEIAGTYVFDFPGLDASQNQESFVGEFTVDGNTGAITTGFFDDNDFGTLSSGAMTPGVVSQDPAQITSFSSFGRGSATIAGQNFVFYIVNSNQVRFQSTNNGMLSGDAIAQGNNVPTSTASFNGGFAFVLAGSSTNGGLTRVGRFTANGATIANVLADTDDAGIQHQSSFFSNGTITFDAANPGRGHVTFQDPSFPFTFVFYLSSPNSGVIQDVTETAPASAQAIVIADGSLAAQSGGPFTSSNITGTYAINWSGIVTTSGNFPVQDEEDLLAQVSVNNLALSGTADIFQFTSGTLATGLGVEGPITINGDGTSGDGHRSGMTVNLTTFQPIDFVIYFVNPQTAFFTVHSGIAHLDAGVMRVQQ